MAKKRDELRKVEVTSSIESASKDHPGNDIRYEKDICYFHQFTGGYMSEVVAIVETEDGRIWQPRVDSIRFID